MSRIGIGLSASAVRVVVVKGRRVTWSSQCVLTQGGQLHEALVRLLEEAPIPRWPQPHAFVSLGPSLGQVRRLSGLPPVSSVPLALAMVRANSDRFFLRLPETAHVAAAVPAEPGSIWAAAVKSEAVVAAQDACRRAGIRLRSFAPACTLLGVAVATSEVPRRIRWYDRDRRMDVELAADGTLTSVTRSLGDAAAEIQDNDGPELCEDLRQLGPQARACADAYGAAVVGARALLSFRSLETEGAKGGTHLPRWRSIAVACAVSVASAAALVAPIGSAVAARMADASRLEAMADSARAAAAVEAELRQLGRSLQSMSEFGGNRPSPSLLLAAITRTIPQGAALVAFRMDSTGGAVVAIGRNVMGVLASLEDIPLIKEPKATSPVTREVVNGTPLERVSITFAFRRTASGRTGARSGGRGRS